MTLLKRTIKATLPSCSLSKNVKMNTHTHTKRQQCCSMVLNSQMLSTIQGYDIDIIDGSVGIAVQCGMYGPGFELW